MTPEFEIERTLVLSTKHIPENEGDLLQEAGETDTGSILQHPVYNYTYGWKIWIPAADWNAAMKALEVVPFTKRLIRLAHALGCQWLRLDADGCIHEDLPQRPFSALEQLAEAAGNSADPSCHT